jgi:hypothetical protein
MSVENDDGEDIALTIQKFANGSNSEILIYCINFLSEMAIFYPYGSGVVVVVVAHGIVCIKPSGHPL